MMGYNNRIRFTSGCVGIMQGEGLQNAGSNMA